MNRVLAFGAALALVVVSCGGSSTDRVIVGAGTTLVDSGFLDLVVEQYQADVGDVTMSVVGLSSAQAIAYAEAGNADVIVTHDPIALATFLSENPSSVSDVAFVSSFIVVAPPGVVPRSTDATAVFRYVSQTATPFVSRDDGSGTHVREQVLWASVPYQPVGESWYTRTGTGMGATLLVADQRAAATLTELGAFLASDDILVLDEVPLDDDADLVNPYNVTAVAPSTNPEALAFMDWLLSDRGRTAITSANNELFGSQVYQLP
ncbi:MAG: substrate-binding domain-containing protein [Acidimicrobiia bacterium]